MPKLFAAGFEDLLGLLVIVAISMIAQWLKSRGKKTEEPWPEQEDFPEAPREQPPSGPAAPPPIYQPARSAEESGWEERLREMLEERTPEADRPATPPPLPPIIPSPSAGQPTIVVLPPPLPSEDSYARPHKALDRAREVEQHAGQLDRQVGQLLSRASGQLGNLGEAAAARQKALDIEQRVAAQLKQAGDQPVALTRVVRRYQSSPEIAQTLALLRQPRTARQAILASVILGPPKALEM